MHPKPLSLSVHPKKITTRVRRSANYLISLALRTAPTWRVLAGDTDNPTIVGYIEATRTATGSRSSSRWTATSANLMRLKGHARNRTGALVILLDSHQRTAGV